MVMAPIPLAFAADTLYLIAARRLAGISQVSANKDVTYAQAADRIAQLMGADRRLVQPLDAAESELDFEAIPRHTTLDMQRLTDTFNLAPVDPWQAVDSVVPMAESMHRCPAAESHEPWLSG
jgi:dTDP-4-dehydrorhamnose reductase